jgi:biopolymer transport protein ExbD
MVDPLKDEVKPEVGEAITITDLSLPMIASRATVPVKIGEHDETVLLKIYEDGKLRWAGMEAGSFDMVKTFCEEAAKTPGFHLVVVTDANVHWQWVHIALETAREAGIHDVGIGVASSADRTGKVLCEYPARQPRTAYVANPEMPELPIELLWDEHGELQYKVFGDVVVNDTENRYIQDLYNRIVSIHADYGAEFEDDYYNSLADPATNPWVLIPRPDIPAGKVMRAAEAVRQCAIKTLRFSDEIPE